MSNIADNEVKMTSQIAGIKWSEGALQIKLYLLKKHNVESF
ncbi:hypothetical protein [Bartonella sp. AC158YNML]